MSDTEPAGMVRARFDPDFAAWFLAEDPPGPAGTVMLQLAGAVQARFDWARPGRMVEVVVELVGCDPEARPDDAALVAIAALLGDGAAGRMRNDGGGGLAGREVALPLDDATAGQRALIARLALLDALREEDESNNPWWAAEAALLAQRADDRFGLGPRAVKEARLGLDALLPLVDEPSLGPIAARERVLQVTTALRGLLAVDDPPLAERLRRFTDRAHGPAPDDLSDELVRLRIAELEERVQVDRPERSLPAFTVSALSAVPASAEERPREPVVRAAVALDSSLLELGELHPGVVTIPGTAHMVWNRGAGVCRVGVSGGRDFSLDAGEMALLVPLEPRLTDTSLADLSARVAANGLLLAVAPVRLWSERPDWGIARVVIPPSIAVEFLDVDVTHHAVDPLPDQPGRARNLATRRAVHGTWAERMGRWDEARRNWEGSAAAWSTVGDENQRAISLAHAAHAARRLGDPALASQLMGEATAARTTWARQRVENAPQVEEVAQPFLAELHPRPTRGDDHQPS